MTDIRTIRRAGNSRVEARAKFEAVEETLLGQIIAGQFHVGAKLPAERELAKEFDVSTITVNKAISSLVEKGLLVSQPRVGTYISEQAFQTLGMDTLYLIASLYDCPQSRLFYSAGKEISESKGLKSVEVRITPKNHEEVANLIAGGAYSVVLSSSLSSDDVIAKAMSKSKGRSVLIAGRLDNIGVHSIMGDDRHMIRMGIEYLQGKGHKNIGLVCCSRKNYVERERIAAWLACYNSDARDSGLMRRVIDLDLPVGDKPVELAFNSVRDAISSGNWDTTALICPDDETAMGVISACYASGLKIPDDMAIISIGNTYFAEHLCPRITSLDPDLPRQISLGIELSMASHGDISKECLLHAVEPKLIERESTSL